MMHPRHRCSEIAYPEHRIIIIIRIFEIGIHTAGVLSYYFNGLIFYYIRRSFVNQDCRYCDWCKLLRNATAKVCTTINIIRA